MSDAKLCFLTQTLSGVLCGIIVLFCVLAVMQAMPATATEPVATYNAIDFARCTRDPQLTEALFIMQQEGTAAKSLAHIVTHRVRVVFKNMEQFNRQFKNYDAISWLAPTGEQMVLINDRHQQAPAPALAALIAHEAMHADVYNSIAEEINSWQVEAVVWKAMIARYPTLTTLKAKQFALVDRENAILSRFGQGTLDKMVRDNPGYHGLPEHSTGF
jgi:hypothetical protein